MSMIQQACDTLSGAIEIVCEDADHFLNESERIKAKLEEPGTTGSMELKLREDLATCRHEARVHAELLATLVGGLRHAHDLRKSFPPF